MSSSMLNVPIWVYASKFGELNQKQTEPTASCQRHILGVCWSKNQHHLIVCHKCLFFTLAILFRSAWLFGHVVLMNPQVMCRSSSQSNCDSLQSPAGLEGASRYPTYNFFLIRWWSAGDRNSGPRPDYSTKLYLVLMLKHLRQFLDSSLA